MFFFPALVFGDDFGNALEFDGSNDYVDCGQSEAANITGSLTIEAWVKPYTKNSNLTIVGNSDSGLNNSGYVLHVNTWNNTDGKIGFETNNGDPIVTEDSVVEFDRWQHVAVVSSGVTATVYVNGEAKKVIGSVNLTSTLNHLFIGAMPDPAYYYEGQIDELRIWNDVRSQQEISDNMCLTLNSNEAGLAAYYQFDETDGSTTLPDITANNNDGTLNNMTGDEWLTSTISAACQELFPPAAVYPIEGTVYYLDFDGVDEYLSIGNESFFDFSTSITIELWMKVNEFNKPYQAIIAKGDDSWRIGRNDSSNTLSFSINSGGTNVNAHGSVNVNDGDWHHVAGVLKSGTMYLYIDGILDASTAASYSIANSNHSLFIGENEQETGRHFSGAIDEVRIWSIGLDQSQIQNNMNKVLSGDETGLAAYWRFDESPGLVANDSTSNNNDGTLVNMDESNWTWSSFTPNIEIFGNNTKINYGDSTPSVSDNTDFGNVFVDNVQSVSKSYSLANSGNFALTLTGTSDYITISGVHASDFSVDTQPPSNTVAANGSVLFTVSFDPSAPGTRTAEVQIESSDPDTATYTFVIQGTGVTPEIIKCTSVPSLTEWGIILFIFILGLPGIMCLRRHRLKERTIIMRC